MICCQVRSERVVSVHHFNARDRDVQFEQQMKRYIKQHFYGSDFRTTSLPSYKEACVYNSDSADPDIAVDRTNNINLHDAQPSENRDKSATQQPVLSYDMRSENELSPSHLSTHMGSRETTASNIKPLLASTHDVDQMKPALFMFHGVGGSADVFNAQIEHFSRQGYEVIAPDIIGHGYSPIPRNKSCYLFKEILLDMFIIFDMYCKRQNIVIGHSYG